MAISTPSTTSSCRATSPSPQSIATLIDGAAEIVEALRADGIKIGSTTGYTRDIMAEITPVAARQGFAPDCLVCTGDTPDGRPTPFMLYRTLLDLGVWPAWSAVKVDDTEVGIAEGLNGGAWTVGVAVSGNVFGLSLADTKALSPEDFQRQAGRRRCSASPRRARTMSSTASPTCCRWSILSKGGWRAASGRDGACGVRLKHGTQLDHRRLGSVGVHRSKAHDEAALSLAMRYCIDSGETLMPWSSAALAIAASSQSVRNIPTSWMPDSLPWKRSHSPRYFSAASRKYAAARIEPAHAAEMAGEMPFVHEIGKCGLGEQRKRRPMSS